MNFGDRMALVARVLPYVARRPDFALKGGTAINLFFRELPRLSVDIDLVFLPITPYHEARESIFRQLNKIAADIRSKKVSECQIVAPGHASERLLSIQFRHRGKQIKVEVNPVARGTVWSPEIRRGKDQAELRFGYLENRVASFEDVYAEKICAALSRQHLRDLFDIKELLTHEGIDRKLLRTFLVYLITNERPMSDLLAPRRKEIGEQYGVRFQGMVRKPISLEELVETREQLIRAIHSAITDDDRAFLMSVVEVKPDWSLIDLPGVDRLPGVRWKLHRLGRLSEKLRDVSIRQLATVLEPSAISP